MPESTYPDLVGELRDQLHDSCCRNVALEAEVEDDGDMISALMVHAHDIEIEIGQAHLALIGYENRCARIRALAHDDMWGDHDPDCRCLPCAIIGLIDLPLAAP